MRSTRGLSSHRQFLWERSKRAIIAIAIVCTLLAGSGIVAWHRDASRDSAEPLTVAPSSSATTSNASPMIAIPGSPSKEYIYVGARLVATEEPAP